MASAQEPGLVRLYKEEPNGNKTLIMQDRVEALAPAGGAADGAPASVSTPEKQTTVDSNVVLNNDDKLIVTFEPDAGGDGLDASDSIFRIPLVTQAGSKVIGRAQFNDPAFADMTLVANEQTVCGYKIVEGPARLAGKIYLDLQDDTA